MRTIEVKQLHYDLTPTAGLALVGHFLNTLAPVLAEVDAALPVRTGVASSDIVRSYLGLLVQGKSDFDAIENLRGDKFFKQALGIGLLPSSPTLRQRMDAHALTLAGQVMPMIERLLTRHAPDYGVLPCGWLPLDIDTFVMDNSGTAKEGVGRTYAGVDGYCPLAAYLGSHGLCLDLVLRPGTQHSAKHTDDDLRRIVPLAQRLSAAGPKAPLLARLDSGFDSAALMACIESMNAPGQPQVDWIIKWNPRSTDAAQMAAELDAAGTAWEHPRVGKRVATWEQTVEVPGVQRPVRRVLRLVERTIGSHGQHLILPEFELEGWTTTLPSSLDAGKIIALYHPAVRRPRHARAVPRRVQDRPGPHPAALGQVRHQRAGVPARGAGDEHPAPDGPARTARARCTSAPPGQATAHQDGDAGADLPGRPADRAWPADGARARGP
jgi:hypothetical protein